MTLKINLDKLSKDELLALRDDIDVAMKNLEKQERKLAIAAAEAAAKEHGFSLTDLGLVKARATKAAAPAEIKYRNPADPQMGWSGRGRQPGWFKDAVAAGTAPEDMAV